MSVSPDYFLPAILDLSSSAIQGIQSNSGTPRTVLDPTGVWATQVTNDRKRWWLSQKWGSLIIPMDSAQAPTQGLSFALRDDPASPTWQDPLAGISAHRSDDLPSKVTMVVQAAGNASTQEGEVIVGGRQTAIRISDRSRTIPPPFVDLPGPLPAVIEALMPAGAFRQYTKLLDDAGGTDFVGRWGLQTLALTGPWVGTGVPFTAYGNPVLIIAQATAYTMGNMQRLDLWVDGSLRDTMVLPFSTNNGSHGACPMGVWYSGTALAPGTHTLGIVNPGVGGTVSDGGDTARVIIFA